MNRLEDNEAEFNEAKVRLFKEHVVHDETIAIVRNLQYDSVGVFPSYVSKDDVPNKIIAFAGQHVQLILKLMSALSHNTGSSFNREFEVGGRRNRWEDIDGLSALWYAASASKAGKFAESQVWIDKGLYRQIKAFNLKCGKPVPTKHVVNAILRIFMDEHKTEIQKAVKRT